MSELIPFDSSIKQINRPGVGGGFCDPKQTMKDGFECVWNAVQHCLNKPSTTEDQYYWFPIKIFHVKNHMTMGIVTYYEVLVGESNFTRNKVPPDELSRDQCTLRENGRRSIYEFRMNVNFKTREYDYHSRLIRDVSPNEKF